MTIQTVLLAVRAQHKGRLGSLLNLVLLAEGAGQGSVFVLVDDSWVLQLH